ncbi:unnamed protein product [Phytophthora fragariaefolia]|uniref:Unnamed protein product n=1 Tax=Phytophthora fragariaefolia TaxID=1490495 RepID=A0A9W6XQR7_9STRA|nr:unnamed protein product [Phytophthora fragariaefolia]
MSVSESYIGELRGLVASGDYGSEVYNLPRVHKKIPESKVRYVVGGFSWKNAVSTDVPALVFRLSCNDVAGLRGKTKIPDDVDQRLLVLRKDNMMQFIHDGVRARWDSGEPSPPASNEERQSLYLQDRVLAQGEEPRVAGSYGSCSGGFVHPAVREK